MTADDRPARAGSERVDLLERLARHRTLADAPDEEFAWLESHGLDPRAAFLLAETEVGLDIVRRLVQRQSGEIELESRPGRTEFRASLPAHEPPRG